MMSTHNKLLEEERINFVCVRQTWASFLAHETYKHTHTQTVMEYNGKGKP